MECYKTIENMAATPLQTVGAGMNRHRSKLAVIFAVAALLLCTQAAVHPSVVERISAKSDQTTYRKKHRKVKQTNIIAVKPGSWGGLGVGVAVEKSRVNFEFDCAEGEITRKLMADERGNFSMDGTYTRQSPGPIRIDRQPRAQPARYEGKVSGKTMTVRVTLADTGEVINTFSVELGREPRIRKCR